MDYPLRSLKSDCRTCYKCIRHCPVKAISFHDGQAHIEQSECLYCGSCYETCPSHAKVIRDDKPRLEALLKEGECYASIAPSFRAAFPHVSFASLQSALRQLGFQDVEETSRGARFVSKAYEEILVNYDVLLSSACPSVNLLLERHYADLSFSRMDKNPKGLWKGFTPKKGESLPRCKKKSPDTVILPYREWIRSSRR